MENDDKLEINQELADELIGPILKIIDDYFFIKFETCAGENAGMLPYPDKLKNLEDAVERLKSRATDMGAMSIILTAYGKDGLREEEKAKEIADIGDAIIKLTKCRVEQVKNAMDYANKGIAGKELFEALGI